MVGCSSGDPERVAFEWNTMEVSADGTELVVTHGPPTWVDLPGCLYSIDGIEYRVEGDEVEVTAWMREPPAGSEDAECVLPCTELTQRVLVDEELPANPVFTQNPQAAPTCSGPSRPTPTPNPVSPSPTP